MSAQDTPAAAATTPASSTAPKRQRVSHACSGCRRARERCDGQRPTCGPCSAQNRACLYRPSAKKRGIPAGYLRTVEVSLEYILERHPEIEEELYQQLVSQSSSLKTRTGRRELHQRWGEGRVRRLIQQTDGLMALADHTSRDATEATDTEGDAGQGLSSDLQLYLQLNSPLGAQSRPPTNAHLPSNWRRLVDIYFTYTHCWLPILSRDEIMSTAAAVPPEGIALHPTVELPSTYAELWAVFALASFQDAASLSPSNDHHLPPKKVYSIARDMIPPEDKKFEIPHLRALIIHSVVLVGQGAGLAAWMLVGTTVRLALHMRRRHELERGGAGSDPCFKSAITLCFSACLMLNTITSACLNQPTFLNVDVEEVRTALESMAEFAVDDSWDPVPGVSAQPTGTLRTNPLKNFKQLCRFTQILSASLDTEGKSSKNKQCSVSPEDLLRSLDVDFSFCNSLIFGSCTPSEPSAFVLHTTFIVSTIYIVSGFKASLLSSLMDVVESCVSVLGACVTPPIVVGLLGIARRFGHMESMPDSERARMVMVIDALRNVWRPEALRQGLHGPWNQATPVPVSQSLVEGMQWSRLLDMSYGSEDQVRDAMSGPGFTFSFADDTPQSFDSSSLDAQTSNFQPSPESVASQRAASYENPDLSFLFPGWMGWNDPNAAGMGAGDVRRGIMGPNDMFDEHDPTEGVGGLDASPHGSIDPDLV